MAPDMLVKDQAFSCPTAHGIVAPGEKKFVSVFFRPETLDVRTMDYLSIVPSGCASQTLLKVVGFSRGTGSPRSLHCLQRQEQPLLTTDKHLLLDAWGLLTLSLGVCCPLVGSARNQLRSPGDTVPIFTPRLPTPDPQPLPLYYPTWWSAQAAGRWGAKPFQSNLLSPGSTTSHPWDPWRPPRWPGPLTATPPPPPPPPRSCPVAAAPLRRLQLGQPRDPLRAVPVDGEQVGLHGLLPL